MGRFSCVAFIALVVLLQESPSSALPGPNILVTATEASLASFPVNYLSQKKDDFVSSMRSALGSIQGSLSANSDDTLEKIRARRALMVECCGFYRCINGNKKTTTTCKKEASSGGLNLGLPALPTLPPVDGGLLGAVGDLLGGGVPTIPAIPTLPPLNLNLPSIGETITILGSGPCPTGYSVSNGTAAAAAGNLLGGLLGG